ncbi:MAG TPA: pitrilysin family protein [Acidimicrobiales bacterium]|nr:pitrilysin family protein [Acidimicrobiales bacterium]
MPAATRRPRTTLPVERFTLANGLRVVLQPDRTAPAVCVAVYYDVGFRSEPKGRTGFAHLFEHLMFEGSVSLEKLQHAKLVQGNGGVMNGSTNTDYTNYFEVLPSNALELGLFLESDRMLRPRLTEETLQNQIEVVKEEIRVNVLNRPYGGWQFTLPEVMFKGFNNSHNGYGSFVDLESATVADAEDFFQRYYAPANAVLAVTGDLDVVKTTALIERHFGDITARPKPPMADTAEALPTKERRRTVTDAMAPSPMVAMGYRVPDPLARFDEYMAMAVLCEVLTDGEAGRLTQRLVKKDRTAIQMGGFLGPFGDPFEARDPTMLQIVAFYPGGEPDPLLDAIDSEIEAVAEGISEDEVRSVGTRMAARYLGSIDSIMQRGLTVAVLEQQRGRGELVNEIPAAFMDVSAEAVAKVAAEWTRPKYRAVLDTRPAAS